MPRGDVSAYCTTMWAYRALTGKLTALGVTAAAMPESDNDGDGLMMRVKPSGSRSCQVRVQHVAQSVSLLHRVRFICSRKTASVLPTRKRRTAADKTFQPLFVKQSNGRIFCLQRNIPTTRMFSENSRFPGFTTHISPETAVKSVAELSQSASRGTCVAYVSCEIIVMPTAGYFSCEIGH